MQKRLGAAKAMPVMIVLLVLMALKTIASPGLKGSLPDDHDWWSNGPYGGDVRSLVVDSHLTLYAGTKDSGVFRSTDRGESWQPANEGLAERHITMLALVPDDSALLAIAGGRAFISEDQGQSWKLLDGLGGDWIDELAISPGYAQDHTLFVRGHDPQARGQGQGALLFRSTDGGHTWKAIWNERGGSSALLGLAISPAYGQDQTLFVMQRIILNRFSDFYTHLRLYKSTDGGETWRVLRHVECYGKFYPGEGTAQLSISPAYAVDQTLFFQVSFSHPWGVGLGNCEPSDSIVISTDGGETWAQRWMPWPLAFSPNYAHDHTIFSPGYRSSDGGTTWSDWAGPWPLTFSPRYTTDQTIFGPGHRSTDGGLTWSKMTNVGLADLDVLAVALSPGWARDGTILAGTEEGLYRSTDKGSSWQLLSSELHPQALAISPGYETDGTLFAAADNSLWRSTARGESWVELTRGDQYGRILSLAISPGHADDYTLFMARHYEYPDNGFAADGVYRSTDGGIRWEAIGPPAEEIAQPWWEDDSLPQILAISPDFAEDGLLLVACGNAGLWSSRDRGATWIQRMVPGASHFRLVAISPTFREDHTIFCATTEKLFLSVDGGESWEATPLTEMVSGLAFSPHYAADRTLFVGTLGRGVFMSTDAGQSWSPVNESLTSLDLYALAIGDANLAIVYAATGGGVWQREVQLPGEVTLVPVVNGYEGTTDTYLHSRYADRNYGGYGSMVIRGDGAARPLLRFDLVSALPAGVDIKQAVLRLYASWGGPQAMRLEAYRVLRPWGEMAATWRQARPGELWSAPGCGKPGSDRDGKPAAATQVAGAGRFYALDVTSLVQAWVDDPASNQGLLLLGQEAPGGAQYELLSSEHQDVDRRPRLQIRFAPHQPTPSPTSTPEPTLTATPRPSPAPTREYALVIWWKAADECPPGRIYNPSAIAAGSDGRIYVSSLSEWDVNCPPRFHVYDPSGSLVSAWDLEHDADDMAVGPEGRVYVLQDNTIRVFTSDGEPLLEWGSEGGGEGQFAYPEGLAVDDAGSVYVADTYNHRVQVFLSDGTFLAQWGRRGNGAGEFDSPTDLAVGPDRRVYVCDSGNHRIEVFTPEGTFITQWGREGSGEGQFIWLRSIAVGPNGDVYVADGSAPRLQVFTADGGFIGQWTSSGFHDLTVGPDGRIYVVTYYAGVQVFTAAGELVSQWRNEPIDVGIGRWPLDVATSDNRRVYVADAGSSDVAVFNWRGGRLGTWTRGLGWPSGLAADRSGRIYVADAWRHRIQAYTSDGRLIASWGSEGNGTGEFRAPQGVAVDDEGQVYVADKGNHRVQVFTSDGAFIRQWGSYGNDEGEFNNPTGVAVGGNGRVYVADSGNDRIQAFTTAGEFMAQWGSRGQGSGQFEQPWAVAVGPDGRIYVADRQNHRLQVFMPDGTFITQWGREGNRLHRFSLPSGVAVDAWGRVYVADTWNDRLQIFQQEGLPTPTGTATPTVTPTLTPTAELHGVSLPLLLK